MPPRKQTKTLNIQSNNKALPSPIIQDNLQKIKCCKCGKEWKLNQQATYFYQSKSSLYQGNNGYFCICKICINSLFYEYKKILNNECEAMRRVCMKWDIYYNESIFNTCKTNYSTSQKLVGTYLSKLNLSSVTGSEHGVVPSKTYDDTINEELDTKIDSLEDLKDSKDIKLPQKMIKFWGVGYTPEEYRWLDDEYVSWIIKANGGEPPSKSLENMLKQICQTEVDIQRARQDKQRQKEIPGLLGSYEKLLQRAGLQPIQEDSSSIAEKNSLGVLIDYWENTEPVPEPESQFKDVDKIKHYINVWFTGHLSRIFGYKIDDTVRKEYQAEIDKYKVHPPEIEELDYGDNNG